jgi:hypothetical protein
MTKYNGAKELKNLIKFHADGINWRFVVAEILPTHPDNHLPVSPSLTQ